VDWSRFALVVVRSAWDYAERWREFLRWAETVPRLENPLPVLRFGVDKERYLTSLAAAGVPLVPTEFVRDAETFRPPSSPFVVKPAISAGGRRSARFDGGDAAAAALVGEILAAGDTAMIQPLLEHGQETALVFMGGAFSHSLRRGAALPLGAARDVLYLEEQLGEHEATVSERRVAAAALEVLPARTLYARVDLLGGAVLELEVVEPSLYLAVDPDGAAERFAGAVASRLARR
jgi:glutathione synthase/RimK-type ligase-like ATP-grasp enzyme